MIFKKTKFQEYAGGVNTRENSMPNKTRSKMAIKGVPDLACVFKTMVHFSQVSLVG